MSNLDGTVVYAHNVKNALSGSDERVRQVLGSIAGVGADVLFLSEAYDADKDSTRIENVAEDVARFGYDVLYCPYSEAGRPDQHGYLAAVNIELGGQLEAIRLAGRGAVEMTLLDRSTARPLRAVGMHANDRPAPRRAELAAFSVAYDNEMKAGLPVLLLGDLNTNGLNHNLLTKILRVGGAAARFGIWLHLLHEAEPGISNPPLVGRATSILNRASRQATGAEYEELLRVGFIGADRSQATALVPDFIPPRAMARLERHLPAIKASLEAPHLQLDHLMASQGSFDRFTVHQRSDDDDHLGISAVYHLSDK